MNPTHFEIHVTRSGDRYFGAWRVCDTQNLDQGRGESQIPLGKRLTREKLEDFCLNVIAKATSELLPTK